MGMKKTRGQGSGLGRALIKERLNAGRGYRRNDTWLHTSELNDGYDWGRLNLQSVTEQSSLDDFLATAELAGTEFVAEKLNIKFVPAEARAGLLSTEETTRLKKLHEDNKQFLRIPRRSRVFSVVFRHCCCAFDCGLCNYVLQQNERDRFLTWRRELARLEEEQKLILTPFERNLDFWRQLWRVIERSDVVVQIVDARNPLLFRCPDLEKYVKEVTVHKVNMLLLNKADLLTREQRRAWARYFQKEGIRAVFWSALAEAQRLEAEEKVIYGSTDEEDQSDTEQEASSKNATDLREEHSTSTNEEKDESAQDEEEETEEARVCVDETEWQTCSEESGDEDHAEEKPESSAVSSFYNSSRLLRKNELLEMFKSVHSGPTYKDGQITVGWGVGYPNVGKSSTINTILRNKKVSVSATPGHTKHFQVMFVDPGLCLCDCPELVMPSFVSTKAEMICSGILPIDQMRDHVPAISLVCQTIPRTVLEGTYGINIIRPREDEDPDRPPTHEELLMAYGYMRGFMTAHGQPDQSRSARYILKDYVNGKLLYCDPPPHINTQDFQPQHARFARQSGGFQQIASHADKPEKVRRIENTVDKHFFHQENVQALTKGVQMVMGYKPGSGPVGPLNANTEQQIGKPWKKHGNRNKKEKVRRLNKHLCIIHILRCLDWIHSLLQRPYFHNGSYLDVIDKCCWKFLFV
ncbi:large subunit GTPase 1 homolog [Cyprinus carpio]|uniref:Large subunit GTPase 1 homolog n=1 Tax=Cyprinus carpio TaxID=7962 RepID=A0A9R0B525_CYPCA|nr:large subunit GTPase 1 homolog [Cyprinus carpio]